MTLVACDFGSVRASKFNSVYANFAGLAGQMPGAAVKFNQMSDEKLQMSDKTQKVSRTLTFS